MTENGPQENHQNAVADTWFATAFGDLYPVVYAHRTVEAAAPEAAFARRQAALKPTDRILDCGCGTGRHLIHIAPGCRTAVGLDYSSDLLRRARPQLPPTTVLIRGDMRRLPFAAEFDVLFSFFTSFGYFSDAENATTAFEMGRILRPGGRLFLDYLNPIPILHGLTPYSIRHREGLTIEETRWIDDRAHRVNKRVRVRRGETLLLTYEESVRLYPQDALIALFEAAGLVIDHIFGACDGSPWRESSPRQILLAHKPE